MAFCYEENSTEYSHELETTLIKAATSTFQKARRNSDELEKSRREFSSLESGLQNKIKILEKELGHAKNENISKDQRVQALDSQLAKELALTRELQEESVELQRDLISLKHSFLPKALAEKAEEIVVSPRSAQFPKPTEVPTIEFEENGIYNNVSIMVVTIVHFNKLVEQLTHTNLMLQVLKTYHQNIHSLLQEFTKIDWIETIGDTVIFVSGAPQENYRHAEDIADFALRLNSWSNSAAMEPVLGPNAKISLRIGIHSGPVTAALIGKIPKFVLLGETVNLAAKIESECNGISITAF